MEDLVYWLWLSLCVTPTSTTFIKLYTHMPSAKDIFALDEETVCRLSDRNQSDAARILRHDLTEAERLLRFCERKQIGIVTFADDRYPPLLRSIENPPVLLYYRGTLPDFAASFPCAVVGTRSMSDYGRKSAFYISLDLARAGATLVSGMAIGIDGVSLSAACAVKRPCVAVLGCGIDICYPKEHLTLAREIVRQGAIVTEYPPGTPAYSYHFPQRNRIISGMCAATAVIEGQEQSGSLITARYAKGQGRVVYALPGNVDAPTSEVTSLLLKNGARPLTSADDILRDFEFVYTGILNPYLLCEPVSVSMTETLRQYNVAQKKEKKRRSLLASFVRSREFAAEELSVEPSAAQAREDVIASLTETQRGLYDKIPEGDSCDIEALTEGGMPMHAVMRELLKLELLQCVELLPGERVKRK